MSYYSDVGLCVNKKYVEQFEKSVAERCAAKNAENLLSPAYVDAQGEQEGHKIWIWDCMKWYEDSPDVDAIISSAKELDMDDAGDDNENYLYIEKGESEDHCVIHGNWHHNPFNLSIIRRLDYSMDYVIPTEDPKDTGESDE